MAIAWQFLLAVSVRLSPVIATTSREASCTNGPAMGTVCAAQASSLLQARQEAIRKYMAAEDADDFEAEADEPGQRALLSMRVDTSRSCHYCHCMVTDAVACGTDTVKDSATCGFKHVKSGAECGWKTVKSIAQCGNSATKVCSYGRRRRWTGFKCSWEDVANSCEVEKSCDVPKSCEVPKTCDMASTFSECLDEISDTLSGDASTYMQLVRNTECESIDECKTVVKAGLSEVSSLMGDAAQAKLMDWISRVQREVGPDASAAKTWAGKVYNEAGPIISSVSDKLANVSSQMVDYLEGASASFPKYDLGSVCTETDVGFWSVTGTDCGSFAAMQDVFDDLVNTQSKFNIAKDLFITCLTKTGLFGLPTPFMELTIEPFCLPGWIKTGAEYLIGGVLASSSAIKSLVEDITGVVQAFADANIGLMQLGRAMLGHSTKSSGSDDVCGVKPDWGVDLTVKLALSVPGPSGESFSFSLGIGIGMGCVGGSLVTPNALLSLWVPHDHDKAATPGASTADVGVSLFNSFPSFSAARAQTGALVTVTGGVDFEPALGIPAGASLPELSFMALPAKSAPKGLYFSISRELGSGLEQLGARVQQAAQDAHRSATTRGASQEVQAVAAMAAAAGQMAGADGLRSSLAGASPDRQQVLRRGVEAVEGQTALAEAGIRHRVASITLSSELAFIFCITPAGCS